MSATYRPEQRPEQRIAKLLARAGVASRREIERMIAEGRIALDGKVLETPATLLRSLHGVTVDGEPVAAPAPARLFLFHKPAGLLTTERDPAGRPTIYDRLPADLPRLVPVGRLDLNTEGLLLLTTDGGLKRQLELPATGVERAYRARAYGEVSQTQLEELIEGVEIEGMRYGPIDANLERRTGANTWIEMILTEGKNREVRRVLEHLGLEVSRLIRTRYGPFLLGDLQPGEVGEVRQHDLIAFRRSLEKKGTPTEAVSVEARAAPARAPAAQTANAPSRQRPARPPRPQAGPRADAGPARSAPARRGPEAIGDPAPRARLMQAGDKRPQRSERAAAPATTRSRTTAPTPTGRGARTEPSNPRARTGPTGAAATGRTDRRHPDVSGDAPARNQRPAAARDRSPAATARSGGPARAPRPPRAVDDGGELTTSLRPDRRPARGSKRPAGPVPPRGPRRPGKR